MGGGGGGRRREGGGREGGDGRNEGGGGREREIDYITVLNMCRNLHRCTMHTSTINIHIHATAILTYSCIQYAVPVTLVGNRHLRWKDFPDLYEKDRSL